MVKQGASALIKIRDDYALLLDVFAGSDARLLGRKSQRLLLRHDVDHNLELALRLGEVEAEARIKSTFFVRTDTQYAREPDFIGKISYLESLGHEIGYHCNAMSQAVQTQGSVSDIVAADLQKLRRAASVRGVSAHGDSTNYTLNVSNLWTWSENEANYSARVYLGGKLNAEGTVVDSDGKFIDELVKSEPESRSKLARYSVSAEQHGLEYEAVFIQPHSYWTDSGGNWIRGGKPSVTDLETGLHQVLIHPEYVFEAEKPIFVLSFPRSGTKYCRDLFEEIGIGGMEHESSLNRSQYRYRNQGIAKRTNFGMAQLQRNLGAQQRLTDSWLNSSQPRPGSITGVVEPYAGFLTPEVIEKICHKTETVILVRDPVETILSLVERGWHSQPLHNKPILTEDSQWEEKTQVEKLSLLWLNSFQKFLHVAGPSKVVRLEDLALQRGVLPEIVFSFDSKVNIFTPKSRVDPSSTLRYGATSHPSDNDIEKIWSTVGEVAESFGYRRQTRYSYRPKAHPLSKKVLSDFSVSDEANLEALNTTQIGSGSDLRTVSTYSIPTCDSKGFLRWTIKRESPSLGTSLRVFIGSDEKLLEKEIGRLDPSDLKSSGSFGSQEGPISRLTIVAEFANGERNSKHQFLLSIQDYELTE